MTTSSPTIGVFDSGFGGLTVLKALLELIPDADYFYFGDTARLPYGSKSAETVAKYAVEATHFLEKQGAGLLVIACNTATALALDRFAGRSACQLSEWSSQERSRPPLSSQESQSGRRGNRSYDRQPCLSSERCETRGDGGKRESLSVAGAVGGGRVDRTPGNRAGGENLFREAFADGLRGC